MDDQDGVLSCHEPWLLETKRIIPENQAHAKSNASLGQAIASILFPI
jgi:hypothetical protein